MNQIQKVKQAQYSTLTLEYLQLFALAQKAQTDVLLEVFCFYMQYAFLFENSENELNSCEVERGLLYATQRIIERPIKYVDPDGKWVHIVIGAGIGALVSTAMSITSQLINNGEIDLTTTVLALGAGAISGGLAASGVGLIGQIAANGAISGVHNVVSQRIENGNFAKTDLVQLGLSIATGMLSGLLGGKGAETGHMRSITNQLAKRITNAFQHKTGDSLRKELVNAFSYYIKSNAMKYVNPETLKAILRSNIPAACDLGKDGYDKMIKEIQEENK